MRPGAAGGDAAGRAARVGCGLPPRARAAAGQGCGAGEGPPPAAPRWACRGALWAGEWRARPAASAAAERPCELPGPGPPRGGGCPAGSAAVVGSNLGVKQTRLGRLCFLMLISLYVTSKCWGSFFREGVK